MGPGRSLSLASSISLEAWLLFAAFLGLGAVMEHTGTAQWLAQWLIGVAPLSDSGGWTNVAVVSLVGTLLSIVTTNLGAPVLYTGLAPQLAEATAWPIEAVLMLGVPAWTFVPFMFQAPIVVIAMRMSGMSARGLSGFMLGYALLAAAILIPLYVLWMQAIGTFGTIIR
jgi:hypothetical protein